jgi:hypothetical protein
MNENSQNEENSEKERPEVEIDSIESTIIENPIGHSDEEQQDVEEEEHGVDHENEESDTHNDNEDFIAHLSDYGNDIEDNIPPNTIVIRSYEKINLKQLKQKIQTELLPVVSKKYPIKSIRLYQKINYHIILEIEGFSGDQIPHRLKDFVYSIIMEYLDKIDYLEMDSEETYRDSRDNDLKTILLKKNPLLLLLAMLCTAFFYWMNKIVYNLPTPESIAEDTETFAYDTVIAVIFIVAVLIISVYIGKKFENLSTILFAIFLAFAYVDRYDTILIIISNQFETSTQNIQTFNILWIVGQVSILIWLGYIGYMIKKSSISMKNIQIFYWITIVIFAPAIALGLELVILYLILYIGLSWKNHRDGIFDQSVAQEILNELIILVMVCFWYFLFSNGWLVLLLSAIMGVLILLFEKQENNQFYQKIQKYGSSTVYGIIGIVIGYLLLWIW